MLRVLFSGSRTWTDREQVKAVIKKLPKGSTVIHGASKGLDTIAGDIAKEFGYNTESYPAEWSKYGPRAGNLRNTLMLDQDINMVVAFRQTEDSRGTNDCIRKAKLRGFPVVVIDNF